MLTEAGGISWEIIRGAGRCTGHGVDRTDLKLRFRGHQLGQDVPHIGKCHGSVLMVVCPERIGLYSLRGDHASFPFNNTGPDGVFCKNSYSLSPAYYYLMFWKDEVMLHQTELDQ